MPVIWWIFSILFFILGILNTVLIHVVPGLIYLMPGLLFCPPVAVRLTRRTGIIQHPAIGIVAGLTILFGTLAVGDLMELFEALMLDD